MTDIQHADRQLWYKLSQPNIASNAFAPLPGSRRAQ